MDPPQAVQTISITYYTHREDMVASLYFLIVKSKGQRSSSVSPHIPLGHKNRQNMNFQPKVS